jgi:hypothetical protein
MSTRADNPQVGYGTAELGRCACMTSERRDSVWVYPRPMTLQPGLWHSERSSGVRFVACISLDSIASGLLATEGHESQRRITIVALWPPKPKEFETATFRSGTSRASFGT